MQSTRSRSCAKMSANLRGAGRRRVWLWPFDSGRRNWTSCEQPSKATVASSLNAITGRISQIKNTIGIADIMALGDVRAREWSVIDCQPRTQDLKLTVGSGLCKCYQKGRCKFGDECKFQHASTGNENTRGRKGKGNGKSKKGGGSTKSSSCAKGTPSAGQWFDKNRCNHCNEITDPRHCAAMSPRALAALKERHHLLDQQLFSNHSQCA